MLNWPPGRIIKGTGSFHMYQRIISLTLIAAVFGCPLWCSMGICQCGSGNGAFSETCMASGNVQASCCQPTCCSGECQEAPHPCPPCSSTSDTEGMRCQGICGGAVFESPRQIPEIELRLILSLVPSASEALTTTRQDAIQAYASHECNWQKHRGGSLRLWMMSFQC